MKTQSQVCVSSSTIRATAKATLLDVGKGRLCPQHWLTASYKCFQLSNDYCALLNVKVRGIAASAAEKAAEDFRELLEIFSRVSLQCV